MSFALMVLFIMLLCVVGVMLRDVLFRRVVRAAIERVFGGLGVAGAEQHAILEHVELREPDRARGGAQRGRVTVLSALGVRGWVERGAGPVTRV
jgi:hypothetical protein